MDIRRIVTGHNRDHESVFVSDSKADAGNLSMMPGTITHMEFDSPSDGPAQVELVIVGAQSR